MDGFFIDKEELYRHIDINTDQLRRDNNNWLLTSIKNMVDLVDRE